jgi:hypothetical protein
MKCHYEERSDVVILRSELSKGISCITDAYSEFLVGGSFLRLFNQRKSFRGNVDDDFYRLAGVETIRYSKVENMLA